MKYKDYEIAIILKKVIYENDMIGFIPEKIVEGFFDEENNCFIDFEGTPYYHIIYNPETYGFCNRKNINEIKKQYPLLNIGIIKSIILHNFKKYYYMYFYEDETNFGAPMICYGNKKMQQTNFLDDDILIFYYNYYRNIYDLLVDGSNQKRNLDEINRDRKLDINEMFNSISTNIINQDEPIKEILTVIWKHYNNFNDEKSRCMLIKGDVGVGKSEIFKLISKLNDIPIANISLRYYHSENLLKKICEVLYNLIKKSNSDLERAQRGILIINDIDKIANDKSDPRLIAIQETLYNMIQEGIILDSNSGDYTFDLSKLLIVGIGEWSQDIKRNISYKSNNLKSNFTKKEVVNYGMIPELADIFTNFIEMNELKYEDLLNILKSENSILNRNREFLLDKGVNLKYDESVLNLIASIAFKNKRGVKGIDEIIEKALSVASFEIASNPDKYSELIINEETIEDNKKYTLIRKSEN